MIPPDIGDLGHSDARDKRRTYRYREYSIIKMMDDGHGEGTGYIEDTLVETII